MITQPYRLYIERKDATKNMARFYSLEIGSNLFGEICLTRRWGRIGARGQTAAHQFSHEKDAIDLFLDLARRKLRRGYRPRMRARPEKELVAPPAGRPPLKMPPGWICETTDPTWETRR